MLRYRKGTPPFDKYDMLLKACKLLLILVEPDTSLGACEHPGKILLHFDKPVTDFWKSGARTPDDVQEAANAEPGLLVVGSIGFSLGQGVGCWAWWFVGKKEWNS